MHSICICHVAKNRLMLFVLELELEQFVHHDRSIDEIDQKIKVFIKGNDYAANLGEYGDNHFGL